MNDKEYILCAAVWFDDSKKHEHQPVNINTGFVVCGRRHHNCYIIVAIMHNMDFRKYKYSSNEQGFLTSKDRFVNREEAGKIAFEANQIKDKTDCLFSEDLY